MRRLRRGSQGGADGRQPRFPAPVPTMKLAILAQPTRLLGVERPLRANGASRHPGHRAGSVPRKGARHPRSVTLRFACHVRAGALRGEGHDGWAAVRERQTTSDACGPIDGSQSLRGLPCRNRASEARSALRSRSATAAAAGDGLPPPWLGRRACLACPGQPGGRNAIGASSLLEGDTSRPGGHDGQAVDRAATTGAARGWAATVGPRLPTPAAVCQRTGGAGCE
jgi:hypothetical protein